MTTDFVIAALGVFVGALGVLFTAGAIWASVILFRQSRDYQRQIDDLIARSDERLEAWLSTRRDELKVLEDQVKVLVESAKNLPDGNSFLESLVRLQDSIETSRAAADIAHTFPHLGGAGAFMGRSGQRQRHYKCTNCGAVYWYQFPSDVENPAIPSCPRCGAVPTLAPAAPPSKNA